MSNVYDQAHKLAKAIRASEEYKLYKEKRKILCSDEKNKKMVEDFQEKLFKLQMDQFSGKEVDESELDKLKKLEDVLILNPIIKDYFIAEMRFSQLVHDINNIIGEAIDLEED
ncbi:cell fate (sporulation/competence/biofilm development) regulator YlbF (YheA/YmcA/DUF963 family) [Keratinibaculum paraultunense]|uniref:Cell fate (Sporulation/competence/biofilm development) regulator YlbF (YheA/YmcA/DUF963 family) n=1 Tax=Keratinibaculum paraultunense TaxID=1278232 RepID=A0A4R3KZ24_9FIRM|nr:YlbF family regulator [Keratinibaculum paraultunense]QQY80569.1 YlbF family regulator [Keratinibaculum paraultunense]TCS91296.1 cell fate (sporulation/competence/biofilm development) regulator YlbF (YheA/YmcA/DUF963 family) [Keratinibaculum paraultunense]